MKYIMIFIDNFVPAFLDMLVMLMVFYMIFGVLYWSGLDKNIAAVGGFILIVCTKLEFSIGFNSKKDGK